MLELCSRPLLIVHSSRVLADTLGLVVRFCFQVNKQHSKSCSDQLEQYQSPNYASAHFIRQACEINSSAAEGGRLCVSVYSFLGCRVKESNTFLCLPRCCFGREVPDSLPLLPTKESPKAPKKARVA